MIELSKSFFAMFSLFEKNTGTSVPRATLAAPVKVAKSIIRSGLILPSWE